MSSAAMPSLKVIVTLDVMMARRKVRGKDLAEHVGITEANLSLLKQGHVKGVKFDTLASICAYLDCTPGDILAVEPIVET
jgi:putative transcriptional regulator